MSAPVFASQAAADLAADLGMVDVEIEGTGRGGRVTVNDVRAAAPPDPPDDLSEAGAALWRAVVGEWSLRPDQDHLLSAACRTTDEITTMERALATADPVVTGSKAQPRPHPLLAEVRAHRLALRQLLASLGITEADDDGGDAGLARSAAGRKLARQRWDRR